MTILFISKPGARYHGRLEDQERELPVSPTYEHAIEYGFGREGTRIFTETYQNIGHGLSPYRQLAVYRGLRRSDELPRHFDPNRLR